MKNVIKKMQYKHEVNEYERYLRKEIKHFHITHDEAVRRMAWQKGILKERYFGDRYAIV